MAERIYLHGVPGGPGERALFGDAPALYCPDRFALAPGGDAAAMVDALAAQLVARFGQAPLHLIAFSLGSRVAFELAARLGAQVVRLDLIAAAAPLTLGDFLGSMAGGPVFAMARDHPRRFAALVRMQHWLARLAPALLVRLLFASASGGDVALARDPGFRARLAAMLRGCFAGNGYAREITAYVRDAPPSLAALHCEVRLWHGTADSWSPPAMAEALVAALPPGAAIRWFDGLSHYSTLRAVIRESGAVS